MYQIGVKALRRSAEATVAAVLLLLALPFLLIGVTLSLAHYRAWPFFVHERIGLHGRRFRFFKVRTLPPSTDRYASKYALGGVTPPVMRLVRRLHFDELPQLLHVVTGRMAFVGPRPEMPVLHDDLPERFARLRTAVRPGLTCLWQISPHSAGLIGERSEYDRLYVEHRNNRLDGWVMAQTLRKMFTGRTIQLYEIPHWVIDGKSAPRVGPVPTPVPARAVAGTATPPLTLAD